MGGGPTPVDLLILGRGWTADFLISLIRSSKSTITYAATTRDGRDGSIPFTFDPDSESTAPFAALPDAKTVLITFPLTGTQQPGRLVHGYEATRAHSATTPSSSSSPSSAPAAAPTKWIFLGATSTWSKPQPTTPDSPWDRANPRAQAEQALLELKRADAVVPCLAGLYGGSRQPRNFARGGRLAKTKQAVKERGGVHFVHGEDVARGLLALVEKGGEEDGWKDLGGRRWIVSDLRCYDWWDLLSSWDAVGSEGAQEGAAEVQYAKWVAELMDEEGVAVLPREPERLGRVLDGRGWWQRLGVWPSAGRLS